MKTKVLAAVLVGEQLVGVQARNPDSGFKRPKQVNLFKAPKGLDTHGNQIGKGHPAKRLQAMNKSMCQWVEEFSPERRFVWKHRCERMTGMFNGFYESFERLDCGYYNPDIKYGGPNPDESMKGMRIPKNPKSRSIMRPRQIRNRREDESSSSFDSDKYYADVEYESEEMTNEEVEYLDGCDGTETGHLAEFCVDEGHLVKSDSANANKKLKTILATTVKWCKRYIDECHGQRVYSYCQKRAFQLYRRFSLKGE